MSAESVALPIKDVKHLLAAYRSIGNEGDHAWQRVAETVAAAEGRTLPWQKTSNAAASTSPDVITGKSGPARPDQKTAYQQPGGELN